jgi:hypothetical protein
MENFLGSLVRFEESGSSTSSEPLSKTASARVVLTTEATRKIHNILMGISDPRSVRALLSQEDVDFYFPSFTLECLHDLFAAISIITAAGTPTTTTSSTPNTPKVFMGTDASAWEFMNRWKEFPADKFLLVTGLWVRETGDEHGDSNNRYQFKMIGDRAGGSLQTIQTRSVVWPLFDNEGLPVTIPATESFLSWDALRCRLINGFLSSREEAIPFKNKDKKGGDVPEKAGHYAEKDFTIDPRALRLIEPSEDVLRPYKWSTVKTESHWELCNDENSGGTMEEYQVYKSYELQARWCLISCV